MKIAVNLLQQLRLINQFIKFIKIKKVLYLIRKIIIKINKVMVKINKKKR